MLWVVAVLLSTILWGCSKDHDQNDPYVLENTEVGHEAPAPYYDESDG